MKTVLTIITRLTIGNGDDEYEQIWSPIPKHSQFGTIDLRPGQATMLITFDDYCLLIISGTNSVINKNDKPATTTALITRFEQALAQYGIPPEAHTILFHNSQFLDDSRLTTYFSSQKHVSFGYHLGDQKDEPIYIQLLKPLIETLTQYLLSGFQLKHVMYLIAEAARYAQDKDKSLLLLPPLSLQPLFTDTQRGTFVFIGNAENFDADSRPDTAITSAEGFQAFVDGKRKPSPTTIVVVLCELDWTWQSLDDKSARFKGIELVKYLRRERSILNPVLFVSAAPQGNVYDFVDSILFAVGHHFVSLHKITGPVAKRQQISKGLAHPRLLRQGLAKLELIDIQEHYCDTKGAKKLLLHRLKNFELTLPTDESPVDARQLADLDFRWSEQFESLCRQFDLLPTNPDSPARALSVLVRDCIAQLESQALLNTATKASADSDEHSPRQWTVLILDDENDDRYKRLESELISSNRCRVLFFRTAETVLAYLNDAEANNDTRVLIADYRLEEPDQSPAEHQPRQGYDVLAEVATRKDLAIALVAFSAMPRKFLMSTFNQYGIRVEVFSKLDYFKNDQSIGEFAEKIVQLGDDCEESIFFMPKTTHWHDALEPSYRAYRKAPNRDEIEEGITRAATNLINTYKSGNKLTTSFCDYYKLESNSTLTEEAIIPFVRIFAARRFAAYVGLKEISSKPDIKQIVAFIRAKEKAADAGVFATTILAFNLSALPFGLTFEEIRFLKNKCDINVQNFLYFFNSLQEKIVTEVGSELTNSKATLVGLKTKRGPEL